jgi:hypothetical protein
VGVLCSRHWNPPSVDWHMVCSRFAGSVSICDPGSGVDRWGGAEAYLARCGHACRCLFEPRPQPRTINRCNQLQSAPSAATLWVLERKVLACSLYTTSGGVSVVGALNATCGRYNAWSMRPELGFSTAVDLLSATKVRFSNTEMNASARAQRCGFHG